MQILAIIPARGGSKGVPGKNIKPLAGIPLIGWTINAAKLSACFDEIVVSTDDYKTIEVAKNFGLNTPFTRPSELATDDAKSIDVVEHAANFYLSRGKDFDAICLLQPTNPFRLPSFIKKCIEKFVNTKSDSLFSALEVPHEYNPHWIFEENEEGFLHLSTGEKQIIPRRQLLPKAYIRDGSVYLTQTKVLMDEHSLYGEKISYILSDPKWHINIDTQEDWHKASILAEKFLSECPT